MFPIMQEVMTLVLDKSSQKFQEHKSYIDIYNNNFAGALSFYNDYLKNQR